MLHIINKSPLERSALESCLRVAQSGSILLIEDAVYAASRGHASAARIEDAMGRFKVFALQADLDARGIGDRLIDGVTAVDYGGFVGLVAEHPACHSWL